MKKGERSVRKHMMKVGRKELEPITDLKFDTPHLLVLKQQQRNEYIAVTSCETSRDE